MGQPRPLLSFIFGLFQTNIIKNFTTKIYEKKCPSSIQCRDLNPRPSKNESPPAWPGLTPKRRDSHNKSIQLKLKKYFSDHLHKRSTLFRARLQKDGKRNLLLERGKFQNLWRVMHDPEQSWTRVPMRSQRPGGLWIRQSEVIFIHSGRVIGTKCSDKKLPKGSCMKRDCVANRSEAL